MLLSSTLMTSNLLKPSLKLRRASRWRASSFIEQHRWTQPTPTCLAGEGRVGPGRKGEPNAQAEDEVGRKKALQGHRLRKGAFRPIRQAPRHDQADHQADPRASRHQGAVQDRRRPDQEILVAERLTSRRI